MIHVLGVCVLLLPVCVSHPLAGWVSSPGHPGGYEPNSKMDWERCAPVGHVLTLSILHLDLEDSYECEDDSLKIFGDNEIILKTLCGRMSAEQLQSRVNPSLQSSPGGCLSLSFQADYSNTERHTGFRAFYTVQDVNECWDGELQCSHFCHNYIGGYSCSCKPGYYLQEDQHTCSGNCTEARIEDGVLTPPGSPGPYFENAECSYTLSVDEGMQFVLSFDEEFDVESRDGRCVDSLTIKTDSAIYGPYCGKTAPPTLRIPAQHIQVLFRSDGGGTNTGFALVFKPKLMECPGEVTAHSIMLPLKKVYEVGDQVTVKCETGFTLKIVDQKSFTSVCQKNGAWSPVLSCDLVDCGVPDFPDLVELTEEDPLTTYKHNITFKCVSDFYQLVGEDTFTCGASAEWESDGRNLSTVLPKCIPVCGKNNQTFSAGRVYGGDSAKLGQIPWQLLMKRPARGGASLISDRWAVTAAHVVEQFKTNTLTFYGGMIDALDSNAVTMETEKIIIHPGYEKQDPKKRNNYDNDIALVKMSERVELSTNIMPICLPEKSRGLVLEGMQGTVSGFGGTEKTEKSRYLQYANLIEYTDVPCFKTVLKVTGNMFCAGGDHEEVDACKGDSGGPLFVPTLGRRSPERPFRLKGIVSWGPSSCGDENFKGYYTKVENYLDWIRDTMEKN